MITKSQFIKQIIGNNNTIFETLKLIIHYNNQTLKSLLIVDFLNYNDEIILEYPKTDSIIDYCVSMINNPYYYVINLTNEKSKTLTFKQVVSYYIKKFKYARSQL